MDERVGGAIVAAALDMVGVPFRLQGRDCATGVDCVGLALLSARRAGVAVDEPPPYRLRAGANPPIGSVMRKAGFSEVQAKEHERQTGDIVVVRISEMQPHLFIDALATVIHAHAGIGRVVCMPLPPEWTEISRWRIAPDALSEGD